MKQASLWMGRIFSSLVILAFLAVAIFFGIRVGNSVPAPPPDCKRASVFCVGLVMDAGGLQDNGLQQKTWESIRRSKLTDVVNYLESQDEEDYPKNIAFFAEAGYDVVVTVGYKMKEASFEAAGKYPDTYFIGVDQEQDEVRDNLAGLVFPEDQEGFMAGALAVQVTETGQVGAICSTEWIPAYWRYCEGFRAGAAYMDAEIEVSVEFNDAFVDSAVDDPAWAVEVTRHIIGEGVDVLFADPTATGLAALQYAAGKRILLIGSSIDQYTGLPEIQSTLLTVVVPLVEPGVLDLILSASKAQSGRGTFPAGNYPGKVSYTPLDDPVISAEIRSNLVEIQQKLGSGSLETGVPAEKP